MPHACLWNDDPCIVTTLSGSQRYYLSHCSVLPWMSASIASKCFSERENIDSLLARTTVISYVSACMLKLGVQQDIGMAEDNLVCEGFPASALSFFSSAKGSEVLDCLRNSVSIESEDYPACVSCTLIRSQRHL